VEITDIFTHTHTHTHISI